MIDTFAKFESEVRSYIRAFPTVFNKAKGSFIYDTNGKQFIDFFSGAGSLNYGHNNSIINGEIIKYIQSDRIIHALDMATEAKECFISKFNKVILKPRDLNYKIQFTGPTGTNAIEAALKIARMTKKRSNIIAFTNGYHGHSLGSLSVTANSYYKDSYFNIPQHTTFMPFDQYLGENINTIEVLKKYIVDSGSGVELPAAIILETIQVEGGLNVATTSWLQNLEKFCKENDILLIVDDIQAGNGRTGTFFSFEEAGIKPDIVAISKSIGGGLPLSFILMTPEIDHWKPGQHTGTFRGNNLGFIAGLATLSFWENDVLANDIKQKSQVVLNMLRKIQKDFPILNSKIRGRGLLYGLEIPIPEFSAQVSKTAFKNGLLVELAGVDNSVLKLLPALTIDIETLKKGLGILENAIRKQLQQAPVN